MEASITLKKVGKLIGDRTILAGLTFGVERGSLVAIIGDNNAGKSMLLQILAGLSKAEYGSMYIHGLDNVKRRSETQRLIGYVPHESDLDPWMTLAQNILFIGSLYGISTSRIESRLRTYSNTMELNDYLHSPAGNLPMGTLKKALLVRALIHDPSILLIDEPTAYMDARSIRQTWNLLNELKGKKTILYTSHSLLEVEQSHDRILVMHQGRIVLDGNLDKLLESTLEYHQFQIEFEDLTDELYKKLTTLSTVVTPSRLNNVFHFYGRSRNVFFQVLNIASDAVMIDLSIKKLGLGDLMDSEFARKGLD